MFIALNHILKKSFPSSGLHKISHAGIPYFPDAFSQSMGKVMCLRLQHWGVSSPFNVIKTKPVESWIRALTACPCLLEAGSLLLSPFPILPSRPPCLIIPWKPSVWTRWKEESWTDPLAFTCEPHPRGPPHRPALPRPSESESYSRPGSGACRFASWPFTALHLHDVHTGALINSSLLRGWAGLRVS